MQRARRAGVLYHPAIAPSQSSRMQRLIVCLCALLPLFGRAQEPVQPLVFGINEGVTYRISASEVRERFREIADDLTKILKRPVRIEYMDEYVQMGTDLEATRYDLAYVHPAHYAIRAIGKAHYRLVAVTKGYTDYRASFLIRKDATYQSLADPGIHQVGMPDSDSITAWIVRATLRDALGPSAKNLRLRYTRYQDAVPFMVDYGFAEVGATAASAVIKEYTAKGGKIMMQSRPVPIKELIASPGLSAQDFGHIQQYFLGLEASDEGQRRLAKLGYKGFTTYDENALISLGRWLEGER
jgi:phosphonate transport system substrate-binding protein